MLSFPRSDTSARFLDAQVSACDEAGQADVPDVHQVVSLEARLTKDLLGHRAADEALALLVPRAEDLVVALLLVGLERPGDRHRRLTGRLLVRLLERLLQRRAWLGARELHLRRVHVRRSLHVGRRHEARHELVLHPRAAAAERARGQEARRLVAEQPRRGQPRAVAERGGVRRLRGSVPRRHRLQLLLGRIARRLGAQAVAARRHRLLLHRLLLLGRVARRLGA